MTTVLHWYHISRFLSTLSLRRATFNGDHGHISGDISIHALLAESDFNGDHGHISGDISIHALLAESDGVIKRLDGFEGRFLSTLSLRRATVYKGAIYRGVK